MFTDMKIRTFGYFAKQGITSMKRNKVMSFASMTTVAASLFIFGVFMLMVLNANQIVTNVEDSIEIKAFLEEDLTTIKEKEIENRIKSIEGVKEITYESQEEALKKFESQLGEKKGLATGLQEENPLPASFIIKVNSPGNVSNVSNQIKGIDGIDIVKDGQQTVDMIIRISRFVKILSIVLMIILGVISISLISNTIKLTVFARKREIGIMKYIGATDWFIRWPFVLEGMLLGFFGAIIAIAVLSVGYGYVFKTVSTCNFLFTLLPAKQIIPSLIWDFIIIGVVLGGFGSTISIKKFLAV